MQAGLAATADVEERAVIGAGNSVWYLAQIREEAMLGADCIIGRSAYIGPGVQLGDNCEVQNYAHVYELARLGDGAAGSVVIKDVPPLATVVGSPAGRGVRPLLQ